MNQGCLTETPSPSRTPDASWSSSSKSSSREDPKQPRAEWHLGQVSMVGSAVLRSTNKRTAPLTRRPARHLPEASGSSTLGLKIEQHSQASLPYHSKKLVIQECQYFL